MFFIKKIYIISSVEALMPKPAVRTLQTTHTILSFVKVKVTITNSNHKLWALYVTGSDQICTNSNGLGHWIKITKKINVYKAIFLGRSGGPQIFSKRWGPSKFFPTRVVLEVAIRPAWLRSAQEKPGPTMLHRHLNFCVPPHPWARAFQHRTAV